MSPGRCIHCLAPVTPPAEVCEACLDLLSDLGEDVVEPPPQPAPVNHTGQFHPSPEDWAAYREMSERGSFCPFDQVRAKEPPGHTRGRWGKAIESWKNEQPR